MLVRHLWSVWSDLQKFEVNVEDSNQDFIQYLGECYLWERQFDADPFGGKNSVF